MAYPDEYCLWALDEFRSELGYNPWHFWQLADTARVPVTSACNDVVYEHAWQNAQAAGRSDIARAIYEAENQLRDYLKYSLMPHYVVETYQFPKWYDVRSTRYGYSGSDNHWLSIQLKETQTRAIGVETMTLIGTVPVVYTDEDNDNLDDTFTVSIATTVTDVSQIEVYFQPVDRLDNDDIGQRWRVKPVKVTISGGVATIKGKAWLCVRPVLYEGFNQSELDPNEASNFVTDLCVYRHWYNPDGTTTDTAQAKLIWESLPYPEFLYNNAGSPIDTSSDVASEGVAIARVGIRNADLGQVYIGASVYNATTGIWSSTTWAGIRPPDRCVIRYCAGLPLYQNAMQRSWRKILVALACANLKSPICACEVANKELAYWQFDLARATGSDDESYAFDPTKFDNPFGTRRGHIYAWKQISKLGAVSGFAVG